MKLLITALSFLLTIVVLGQNNYSMSFNGNSNVQIVNTSPNLDEISNSLTFSANIYLSEVPTGDHARIIYRSDGVGGVPNRYMFSVTPNEAKLELHLEGINIVTSTNSITLNEWHDVAGVYDGSQIRVYIDGNLEGANSASGIIEVDEDTFWIASANNNGFFNGKIDNVGVWDFALSAEEIQLNIECPSVGIEEEGLVGFWNFEEGEGETVYDISGNGNDGFVNGSTWNEETNNYQCLEYLCEQIEVTFLSVNTDVTPNTIEFEIDVQYTDGDGFGYGGFVLANEDGDIVAQETLGTAGNVYWIGPGINNEARILIANEELSFPFSGSLYLIDGFFAGNYNAECVYEFNPGCMNEAAPNYDPSATIDDGSCLCNNQIIDAISTNIACVGDTVTIYGSNLCVPMHVHLQGWTIPGDLVITTTQDSVSFIVPDVPFIPEIIQLRYIDELGDSYYTNLLPFTITTPQIGYNCDGTCIQDLDEDGICDACEDFSIIIVDCECAFFDPATYTVFYTDVDEANCIIIEDCYCECINDIDGDGICDENEIMGCTDSTACNYNSDATEDDGGCFFIDDTCDDGDPNTVNDYYNDDCECVGDLIYNIDDLEVLSAHIYPNPASNYLTIYLGDLEGVNATIKLYDSSSKLVFENISSSSLHIDLSSYAQGLYTIELSTSDKVIRHQVVVE